MSTPFWRVTHKTVVRNDRTLSDIIILYALCTSYFFEYLVFETYKVKRMNFDLNAISIINRKV